MDYCKFTQIIHKAVFSDSKLKLLENIAKQPNNYIGLFRPTTPEVKIAQNLSQSHEIKFGYAFEILVDEYLRDNDCELLDKNITIDGEAKKLDVYIRKDDVIYFAEQKMRDNHDSTKKQGQADDFKKKLLALFERHKPEKVHGMIFFVDPGMCKNQAYYKKRLAEIESNNPQLLTSIVYGGEFFDKLGLDKGIWEEIKDHLVRWQSELPGFPEFNYDANPEESFTEIKEMSCADFRKMFNNDKISKEIMPILFPKCETLDKLVAYWDKKGGMKEREISELVKKHIRERANNV